MTPDVVAVAISALALLVAAGNYLTARRSSAQARASLQQTLRSNWRALEGDWDRVLLCVRGVSDYYAGASLELREELAEDSQIFAAAQECETLKGDELDWETAGRISDGIRGKYSASFDRVLDFLTLCADLILCGDVGIADLFSFLGPQVARHHLALRVAAGGASWRDNRHRISSDFIPGRFRGRLDRTLFLTDVLWAELARRGDLDFHQIVNSATHKQRTGSGIQCRLRAKRMVRARTVGASWLLRLKIQVHLMEAEYLSTSGLLTDVGHLVRPRDFRVLRIEDWRMRYLKALSKSALPGLVVSLLVRGLRRGRKILGISHPPLESRWEGRR